jgi:hypothetical protein
MALVRVDLPDLRGLCPVSSQMHWLASNKKLYRVGPNYGPTLRI